MKEADDRSSSDAEYERCQEVLQRHEEQLLALPNVIGVGIGESSEGEFGLVLLVRQQATSSAEEPWPAELEGVPVWHRLIGSIEPQEDRPPGE